MPRRVNPGFLVWVLLGVIPITLAASGKGNPATGQKLYRESCQNCHGTTGKGDSEMAAYLSPAPANLTAKATQDKTDVQLRKVIQKGRPGTAMTGYAAAFDEEKLDDVIAYIRSLKP
jgi:mono/diheme cytochrome c family protein